MKLFFEIDENYLIACIVSGKFSTDEKYKKDIVSFQNNAWEVSESAYNLLRGEINPDSVSAETIKSMVGFLTKTKKLSSYKKLLMQTKQYAKFVEHQWQSNFKKSFNIISDLTGLDLNKTLVAYITHPGLKNGRYLGDNKIGWGNSESFQNYSTIYLWHEILHSYMDKSDLSHAINQLVTDNELRVRLNGGKYPPFEGHEDLFPIMQKVLPAWKKYLKSDNKDILKFVNHAF